MVLILEIKVNPSSGRQSCSLDKVGNLKCSLKNAAQNGKANLELIKFIAKSLAIPQTQVKIVSGHTQRKKLLKIDSPLTYQQILMHLGIDQQMSL